MAWIEAGLLDNLIAVQRKVIALDSHKILLIWHENQVHAVQSQCPHLKLPLMKSQITESNEIVCPFHKSAFNLEDGHVKCWSPWPKLIGGLLGKISKPKSLAVYPVRIEEDKIFVNV